MGEKVSFQPFHVTPHCLPQIFGHQYMSPLTMGLCIHMCTTGSQFVIWLQFTNSLSPVTGHRSYSGLLFRCTPSSCPVSMSKSASQGHRVTFLQLFGILPWGSSSVEACACAWVFVWRVCTSCLSFMPQTAFC